MFKVMIADDEPIVRKGLVNLVDWKSLDCEIVYQANDGVDVLDNLKEYTPDILICDIKMPRLDGIGVAKHIYDKQLPIKMIILTAFADFSYAKLAIKYNVVEYITKANALESIPDAVNKAKLTIEKSKITSIVHDVTVLKSNFLKSVIDGSLYDDDILAGFSNFNIELGNYQVISLQFLRSDRLRNIENSKFYKSISNFLAMAFDKYHIYQIPLSKENFCIIVHQMPDFNSDPLKQVCLDLAETLESFMKLNVIIGISSKYTDNHALASAYQQASLFSNTFFIDNSQKVYSARESDNFSHTLDMQELTDIIDNISAEIQNGRSEQALNYFEQLLELQSNSNMDIIKSTGIILLNICDKFLSTYDRSIQILANNENILSDIFACTLLIDYKRILTNIITSTADFFASLTQNKNKLITDTLAYIDNHYLEDITVTDIAQAVHVNSSYLSRTFKEHTGSTIIATLNERKISKAKKLLSSSNLKIYEVAEAIGIRDTTYFSHFFKKNTGLSPSEYKKSFI